MAVFTNRNGKAVQYWEFSFYPERTEDEIRKMHTNMREHHCGSPLGVEPIDGAKPLRLAWSISSLGAASDQDD